MQEQSPSGEELRPLANFFKSSRKTPTVPLTVNALLEMHKKPSLSNITKICHVQFIKISVANKARNSPSRLNQAGGRRENFMGCFVQQNSDSLIAMRFSLSPTTFLATAIGGT